MLEMKVCRFMCVKMDYACSTNVKYQNTRMQTKGENTKSNKHRNTSILCRKYKNY